MPDASLEETDPGGRIAMTAKGPRMSLRLMTATDGAAGVSVMFMALVALIFGGLAIDYANLLRNRAYLQSVADAAAFSAAMVLPDADAAHAVAADVAASNRVNDVPGQVLRADDIVSGHWDSARHVFVAGEMPVNAVRVTTRRADSNDNPLPSLLLRLVGIDQFQIATTAIGFRSIMPRCSGRGYFSRQRLSVVNANHFRQGFCIHGDGGVGLHNTNTFDPGTVIGMNDLRDFTQHRVNYGVDAALRINRHSFALLDALPDIIAGFVNATVPGDQLPDYLTGQVINLNNITGNTVLQPGVIYRVSGNINLGSNRVISDVAIVTTGDIRINSNVTLRNVVLVAQGSITLNSNNYLGETLQDYCARGDYATYLFSQGNITMNSNNTARGVMMAAQGYIDTGNNNEAADGIYAEAEGPITLGNANSNAGCPEGLRRDVGPENIGETVPQLVY